MSKSVLTEQLCCIGILSFTVTVLVPRKMGEGIFFERQHLENGCVLSYEEWYLKQNLTWVSKRGS